MLSFLHFALGLCSLGTEPDAFHLRMPTHASFCNDQLYGFFGAHDAGLALTVIDVRKRDDPLLREYSWSWIGEISLWYRHYIRYDKLWIQHGPSTGVKRIALDDVPLMATAKGQDAFYRKYGFPMEMPLPALYKKYRARIQGPFLGMAEDVAGFASVPIREDCCKTFLLLKKDSRLEVWDTVASFDPKKVTWKVVDDEVNAEAIRAPFREEFYAFVREQDYFFATESGKLYHAAAPSKDEQQRKIRAVWDDPKKPIVAILEDVERDKVWLFAKDKTAGARRDFFFELGDASKPREFDPATLQKVNLDNRARILLEYLPLVLPKDQEKPRKD